MMLSGEEWPVNGAEFDDERISVDKICVRCELKCC